ncbi:nitroreductase [Nocardioides zeae]|uniref:Nitroreductase n=1 Tax=Nocardioides imazamoxiresistens TaxID=3231893 RepID=A0ABU3PQZ3_9ACTN|nr:nitroreductase [Nocardioides zeae]MDT9591644.1 nitroreductase [Nocardioides zeae]
MRTAEELADLADLDDLDALLADRHSCRAFAPEGVPEPVLRAVLATAQRTASWCNTQPWQVHVVSGAARDRLSRALRERVPAGPPAPDLDVPPGYTGVHDERRRESGLALYASLGIERGDRAARDEQALRNFDFFGAPHALVVTTDRSQGTYGAVDCGGYVATLLLAARAAGLATCAQAAVAMYSDVVRTQLGLAEGRAVVCAVALGRADPTHPVNAFRTSRADVDDVATFVR